MAPPAPPWWRRQHGPIAGRHLRHDMRAPGDITTRSPLRVRLRDLRLTVVSPPAEVGLKMLQRDIGPPTQSHVSS